MSDTGPVSPERWTRIQALFDQALDRPADERGAFLAAACGDDEALRREVESLLEAAGPGDGATGEAEGGLARGVAAVDRMADALLTSTGSAAVGSRLGAYRLDEEIGRGGMGVVYRGVRVEEDFEQTVAVKVLPGATFSPGSTARFRNERRILAGLHHPNIARLLDGGTTPHGVPYVIMEYVDGMPMDRYVRDRGLSLEDRVRLFLSLCDAVSYAHRNLVVHRDLKPSNILVTADGTPKLLDFGIAKLLEPTVELEDDSGPPEAVTGTRLLTPRFASPEQLLGRPVGTPTDVYSLGLVLYRILTGIDARGTDLPDPSNRAGLLQESLERDPAPPSRAAQDARLRGDLDTIVLEALRWDPDDRYDSVAALADDLKRWLSGRPIAARPPSLAYRTRKFVTRNRPALLGTAAAALLLVIQGGLFLNELAGERDQARREAERATRTLAFVTGLFEGANPFESADPDLTARDLLAQGRARLDEELAGEPGVRAEILSTVGQAYQALDVYDSAEVVLRESLELREATFGPRALETARGLAELADLYGDLDRLDEADPLVRRSLEIRRAGLPPHHPDLARSLSTLAKIAEVRGEYARSDSVYVEALAVVDGTDEPLDELRADILTNRAHVLMELSALEAADSALARALALRQAVHGRNHPSVAATLVYVGRLLELKGDYVGAEALFREVIDWGVDLLGEDSPFVISWYNDLAAVVRAQDRNEEALAIQEEVVAGRRRQFDGPHSQTVTALNNVANMYGNLGRFAEADSAFAEALAMIRLLHGDDHPQVATILNNRATLAWRQGAFDRGAALQAQVLEMDLRQLGPDHEYVAMDHTNLGSLLMEAGRLDEAEPHLRRGMERMRELRGRNHMNTAHAEMNWADWLVARGRGAEAVALAREALTVRLGQVGEETVLVGYGRSTLGAALLQAGRLEEAEEELMRARAILSESALVGDPIARRTEDRIEALREAQAGSADGHAATGGSGG